MTSDDLRRIFMGPTLFRLDTILSPRLVPVLYATGLGTLLLWAVTHLVSAFAGRELTLAAYKHAVDQRYRFYSYGDCMLIL